MWAQVVPCEVYVNVQQGRLWDDIVIVIVMRIYPGNLPYGMSDGIDRSLASIDFPRGMNFSF